MRHPVYRNYHFLGLQKVEFASGLGSRSNKHRQTTIDILKNNLSSIKELRNVNKVVFDWIPEGLDLDVFSISGDTPLHILESVGYRP